ncbi:MAG: hypothetical protein V4723_04185 [Pseudomonadota bacterium]
MRFEIRTLSLNDRLLIAVRRVGLLMIFFTLAAVVQLAWDWDERERTAWTFGAACIFLLIVIWFEASRAAASGYLELADGILTHRHNGVEYVVRLAEVIEGSIFSVFGNHSIVLKLTDGRFECELDHYPHEALQAFEIALGPRLSRGGALSYLKQLIAN